GATLAFIFLFVFLYAARWALLPFVLAAVVAYICTPLVQWLANRTRLPRLLFVCAIVIALLAAGTAVALLGGPALIRETASTVARLRHAVGGVGRNRHRGGGGQFLRPALESSAVARAAG